MIRFHSPGSPESTKGRGSLIALEEVAKHGLDGMEVEFTHGVRMGDELAANMKAKSEELGLTLTVHGPFFVNLNSQDKPKRYAGLNYIAQSVKKAHQMGAKSVTFHPAYMHTDDAKTVMANIKEMLDKLMEDMDKEGITDVAVAPELTGKESQYGSIDQLVDLINAMDRKIRLCIDFTHNYARTIGKQNGRAAFQEVLDKVKAGLGEEFLQDLHIHMGGMIYRPKGEKMHRPLSEETEFEWQVLLQVLKENNVSGWATIETPDIEISTKIAKDYYHSL